MKKFLSLIMIAVMLLTVSSFSINAFAQQNNSTQEYKFEGATLDLGTTLSINYYAKAAADYKAQFTMNGKQQVVDAEYDSKMGLYKFAFTGINPQCMNDIVDAKLLDANGNEIDSYNNYSVRQYCNNMASTTAKENGFTEVQHKAMLTLLADTLNYGAQAQLYKEYKADNLVNNEPWVKEYESSFKVPQGIKKISGNQDPSDYIYAAGLSISNVNNVYFRIVLNSENVVITLNNKIVNKAQLEKGDDGTYLLYSEELTATQFDKVFNLVLLKNGQEISSIRYNVKAFIQSKHASATVGGISKALNNYGDSAVYYLKAINNDLDLDFDLGFDLEFTDNVIPNLSGTFDEAISPEAVDWFVPAGWNTTMSLVDDGNGGKALAFTVGESYESAMFNIAPYVKPGKYAISFRYKVIGEASLYAAVRVDRGAGALTNIGTVQYVGNNVWGKFTETFTLSENEQYNSLDFCMDGIYGSGTICIDDFTVVYLPPETEKLVTQTETWIANEMTFIAQNPVDDPLNTRTFDVTFTNGHVTFKMPGFWDGDNVWRVRFALPSEGTWTYTTEFSDTTDSGVHDKTGKITVEEYLGDLDIYKHGFVKTQANTRYFMYADGTPFFYLGDTHWTMLSEEFDSAGLRADGIETDSHFKYIVDKRVEQGFTVYQSEPIGAKFDLTNGLDASDIKGFKDADKYFKYIADKGLVHANSQFFFTSEMSQLVAGKSQAEYQAILDTLTRYWIARFGAYPVMYTVAQEVDNDYYSGMDITPWKYVLKSLYEQDPYHNPISAHQEAAEHEINNSKYNETAASNSSFRDVTGHTWWATQWKAKLNDTFDYEIVKDYWNNGQGKPIVSYEGNYDGYWTNEYGARAQGWVAFLNGMAGHGYGAIDMWAYNSNFDSEALVERNGVTISVEEKRTHWGTSIKYATGDQMGYMREFFENYEWWNLTPAFGDSNKFSKSASHFLLASTGNDLYIAYIFDGIAKTGTTRTGTIKNLDRYADYTYQWFNPRTGEISEPKTANTEYNLFSGTKFEIGSRPTAEDWVLVVQKVK